MWRNDDDLWTEAEAKADRLDRTEHEKHMSQLSDRFGYFLIALGVVMFLLIAGVMV